MRIESINPQGGERAIGNNLPVVMLLDLEGLQGKESRAICGFNRRLLAHLPELNSHYCDSGQMGGFVERLHDGTHLNHIIEHIAIELFSQAVYDCRDENICCGDENDDSKVAIKSTTAQTISSLLPVAAEIADAIIVDETTVIEMKITEAKKMIGFGVGSSLPVTAESNAV